MMNCESCKAPIAELKNTNMELENVRNSPINDFIYLKFNLTNHTLLLLFKSCIKSLDFVFYKYKKNQKTNNCICAGLFIFELATFRM